MTDGRKLSEAALNERRRRAVKMRLGGATIAQTAKLCEISQRTVWSATKAFESGGWAAVTVRHGHRPKGTGRALTPEQEREVQRLIHREFPRLCRGGSSSLTFTGVHPETLRGEPPSKPQGESGWTSMKA